MIGIIGAMALEVENLVKELDDRKDEQVGGITFYRGKLCGREVVLAVCGVGKCFAAMCAQTMISRYAPKYVINIGVAGAVCPYLRVGDMAIARWVVQHDMDTTALGDPIGLISGINLVSIPCDEKLSDLIADCCLELGYRCSAATIASGDQFVADLSKKNWIRETFGAIACEMEGAAIVQACYQNKVPCGVIRSISDALTGDGMDFESFKYFAAERSAAVVKLMLRDLYDL